MRREKATSQPTTKQKQAVCKNCGRKRVASGGRCASCHGYWVSHNHTERPAKLYDRKLPVDRVGEPAWCEVCGAPSIKSSGKCAACYAYWQENRKKRPRRLWDPDAPCKNCGIPLRTLGRRKSGFLRRSGDYCAACVAYKRRTGKPRPRELWGIGPLGWCECGYPAVALVEDIPVCVRHKE